MKLQVKVTQDHINQGIKDDIFDCPIAHAMRGVGLENVEVSSSSCVWTKGESWASALLPEEARVFVQNFDEGNGASPFEFELELP